MKCPECNLELLKVSSKSQYGFTLIVEQCMNCGGIWFDKNELYSVPSEGIKVTKNINLELIGKYPVKSKKLVCPRDNTELVKFVDTHFPKEIDIERCSKCSGFWFSQEDLSHYLKYKTNKLIVEKKDSLDNFLESYASKNYHTLNSLMDFLNMPINRGTMYPESWGNEVLVPTEFTESNNKYIQETKRSYFIAKYTIQTLKIIIELLASLKK